MPRLVLALAIVAACLAPPARAFDDTTEKKIGDYLAACVEAEQFNGTVLVARDNERLVSRGFGLANFEHEIPNTPQTKFRLGSITKQFTAMAIMILQERGKLSVDDRISKYLDASPETWKDVTLHHLLSHTSGIPNLTSFPDFRQTIRLAATPAGMIDRFRDKPLEFVPGEKFAYSNSGYILLGVAIEKAAGKPYEAFLREAIFEPLGMNETGYDHFEEIITSRAAGYQRGASLANAEFIDMSLPYAAGALYSTVGDLHRWHEALSAGTLLSEKATTALFTPVKGDYAYGWNVQTRSGHVVTSHGGGINGFATSILRIPDQNICIVVLSNTVPAPAGRMTNDLASLLLGQPYPLPKIRRVAEVDPKVYDELAGRYELAPSLIMTVSRQGDRLLTQITGQPQVEIFPESESDFFLRVVDAQLTFFRNQEGQVTHLILHQGGRDIEAKRLAAEAPPAK
ncbi:MAG TPA: serine hydrolase [Pirellulales bacterium]|jgi:CubicO group peptidase (beta-lactamase class C family)|nr:serine hydrolase [Pirellulales bacterium]